MHAPTRFINCHNSTTTPAYVLLGGGNLRVRLRVSTGKQVNGSSPTRVGSIVIRTTVDAVLSYRSSITTISTRSGVLLCHGLLNLVRKALRRGVRGGNQRVIHGLGSSHRCATTSNSRVSLRKHSLLFVHGINRLVAVPIV